jgi:hypothetical protein
VFLLFSGLMPSSLGGLWAAAEEFSGRLSDDCDRSRAFWAEPRMPSRLKLGVLADLSDVGDLMAFMPLAPLAEPSSWGEGISMEKSRVGMENCLMRLALMVLVIVADTVPVDEWGESPFEDGDMAG